MFKKNYGLTFEQSNPQNVMGKKPPWILPTIIFTQFAGTSLWFAGNAVLGDLQRQLSIGDGFLGYMTSAVQLGFIVGTLSFAFFSVSDRFSPRVLFFICSFSLHFPSLTAGRY